MTITPNVRISGGNLIVKGRKILAGVPENVVTSSAVTSGPVDGIFLGADLSAPASRHVVPIGVLGDVKFMATFRFMLWWMSQKMGERGDEVPKETQFLLVESKSNSDDGYNETLYTVFLPLVEGSFRACLQGGGDDVLQLVLESGDEDTRSAAFSHAVFVGAATEDPFIAITGAVRAVKSHLKTFRHRAEKRLPGIVDYFGWCTWDAFYKDVTQEGVEAGLSTLSAGGAPPKFVIIDDGWQSVEADRDTDGKPSSEHQRLTSIKENNKFQSKETPKAGIKSIVTTAKEKYGLEFVYVWHAIVGYWGGVRAGDEYNSRMQHPIFSPGVAENEPNLVAGVFAKHGVGLVNPKGVYKFYNELHSYLANAGVDGVKVDGQCILETLGAGLGGRVELTRQYHQALDASVAKNFADNSIIACMSHNTDALYCSKQTAVVRASDDFFPRDPVSHTIHIAACAYNSVFLGEFMLPDWDMFHSLHPAAEFHASARAISGGPIYVSDAPGNHNFELLKKLVLPDGSILRAQLPGRPTKDCLFTDPTRDGKSLLRIWNLNKFTGILGLYNCQGAAWNSTEKKNTFHQFESKALTCMVKGRDVHLISEASTDKDWNGDCVIYRHTNGEIVFLPNDAALPVSLKVLEYEVYTVSPIKVIAPGFRFAPIGLIDMYNAGGAIEGITYHTLSSAKLVELDSTIVNELNGDSARSVESRGYEPVGMVCMEVKGCGRFGTYSSTKPRRCSRGVKDVNFEYDSSTGLVTIQLESMPKDNQKFHKIVVEL